jgi:hypothetical protein
MPGFRHYGISNNHGILSITGHFFFDFKIMLIYSDVRQELNTMVHGGEEVSILS